MSYSTTTGRSLGPGAVQELAALYRALGEPVRLRLLTLIDARPGGEASVSELIRPLGLAQPTVSHHLRVLHAQGLVERERRGSLVYYRVLATGHQVLVDASRLLEERQGNKQAHLPPGVTPFSAHPAQG
jgi:ArsR family transcriptional regulator, arsenate/arsenite/antimonite-responsive transcriptional repressor